jgi:hypothetical protein
MPMILNDEQNMLKDTAKEFCAKSAPIAQLRKLRDEDNADGFDRGTWAKMVELGWAGIPWPEQYGGLAFGYKGSRHQKRAAPPSLLPTSVIRRSTPQRYRANYWSRRQVSRPALDQPHIRPPETKAREKKEYTRSAAKRRSCSTATSPTS